MTSTSGANFADEVQRAADARERSVGLGRPRACENRRAGQQGHPCIRNLTQRFAFVACPSPPATRITPKCHTEDQQVRAATRTRAAAGATRSRNAQSGSRSHSPLPLAAPAVSKTYRRLPSPSVLPAQSCQLKNLWRLVGKDQPLIKSSRSKSGSSRGQMAVATHALRS